MVHITLNRENALRVLNDDTVGADAHTIAACAIALIAAEDAEEFDSSTRAIVLKLSTMIAARIYGMEMPS